jgi:hypothetical protein
MTVDALVADLGVFDEDETDIDDDDFEDEDDE